MEREEQEKKKKISEYLFLSRAGNGSPLQSLAGYSTWVHKRVGHNLAAKQQQKNKKSSVNIAVICTGKQEKCL